MSEQPSTSVPSASVPSGSSVDQTVTDLLSPVIATTGAELLDVEWVGGTLRVIVDEPAPADGSITADRLTEVNRLISPILDQHDPVPGKYLLEVSSPGVERSLRRSDHYTRAIGEDVIVKMTPGSDPRRLRGRLISFADNTLDVDVVEADGVELPDPERHSVDVDEVAKARTYFDWGPASPGPKKNKGKQHGGKKSGGKKKGPKNSGSQKKSQSKKPQNKKSQNKPKK